MKAMITKVGEDIHVNGIIDTQESADEIGRLVNTAYRCGYAISLTVHDHAEIKPEILQEARVAQIPTGEAIYRAFCAG